MILPLFISLHFSCLYDTVKYTMGSMLPMQP
jgi:hypothetical protein